MPLEVLIFPVTIWHSLRFPAGVSQLIPVWMIFPYLTLISDPDIVWGFVFSLNKYTLGCPVDSWLKYLCYWSHPQNLHPLTLRYSPMALERLFENFGFCAAFSCPE